MSLMIDYLENTYELLLENNYDEEVVFLEWLEQYINDNQDEMNTYVATFCVQVLNELKYKNIEHPEVRERVIEFFYRMAWDAINEYVETGKNTFYTQNPNSLWNWF